MFLSIWCNPSCMTRVTKHAIRFRSEMQAQEGGGARKSSTEPSSQCASKVSPATMTVKQDAGTLWRLCRAKLPC